MALSTDNRWIPTQNIISVQRVQHELQWNLSVTTTSIIKFIICDLFNNVL